MPRLLPRSDRFLQNNGVLDLHPDTLLHPEEAAVLLGSTTVSLKQSNEIDDRPSVRQLTQRGVVHHALSDVLALRRMHPVTGDDAGGHDDDGVVRSASFKEFLSSTVPDDEWPFIVFSVRHVDRPVDFFFALTFPIGNRKGVQWLTLADYLLRLQGVLETEPRAELARKRQEEAASHGGGSCVQDKVRPRT